MKLIYPKKTDISDIFIKEISIKYLIYNNYNCGTKISGIIIELDNIEIIKEYNKYKIILPQNNPLEEYDDYLNNNIENYKKIMIETDDIKHIIFPHNGLIDGYHQLKKDKINIQIRYVKKMGFFNIPIINIL